MGAGYLGTFIIAGSQTKVDGVAPGAMAHIAVGATWRWHGAFAFSWRKYPNAPATSGAVGDI